MHTWRALAEVEADLVPEATRIAPSVSFPRLTEAGMGTREGRSTRPSSAYVHAMTIWPVVGATSHIISCPPLRGSTEQLVAPFKSGLLRTLGGLAWELDRLPVDLLQPDDQHRTI